MFFHFFFASTIHIPLSLLQFLKKLLTVTFTFCINYNVHDLLGLKYFSSSCKRAVMIIVGIGL